MPRRRDEDEGYGSSRGGGGGSDRKRRRSDFIDDVAEQDEEEYEEYDEDYGGGGGSRRRGGKAAKKSSGAGYFELEADVDTDPEEEEEEDGEDDFIVNEGIDNHHDEENPRHRPLLSHEDEQEDVEALERRIQQRFARKRTTEYYDDDNATEVEQQALLPSVRDPKLWMVKCMIGHEREVVVCLMQKCIDKGSKLHIRSVIALDHLKNYIYIEADKVTHVKEACKGMRNIYTSSEILPVPIKEMTDVVSVESKEIDLSRDTWVRIKTAGKYKGDLAKVVDVDDVTRRVTVKLIPRIDLQELANKFEGREVPKNKAFTPPPRFMNVDEARKMHIRVERRRDPETGDYFEKIGDMRFKDGFLYKSVAMKSISSQNIQPSFDEVEKFRQPNENATFGNRKKGHFIKGDRVIVIKGDLKNLKGSVEKVEQRTVHIKSHAAGLPRTLAVNERELCKYFEAGNHVKVVSGAQEGVTGMVVTTQGHLVDIVSDTTKEVVQVFSDNVVGSCEVTSGITKFGDFELHDLVQLDNSNFGVIIRVDSEAFQVFKGVANRAEIQIVKLRDIKCKIVKKSYAKDSCNNTVSVKDVVKVIEGPNKGRQGRVEHIYRGILFIYDRDYREHAGFICAKYQSCRLVGANGDRNGNPLASRVRTPTCLSNPLGRGGGVPPQPGGRGGKDCYVGKDIRIRRGCHKGCRGTIVEVNGTTVRVQLQALMKDVTVDWDQIFDNANVQAPYRETHRYGSGSETPMNPSRTPLHPCMRDPGATPIHDGMRTPMRDRAWNPYASMSPPRFLVL